MPTLKPLLLAAGLATTLPALGQHRTTYSGFIDLPQPPTLPAVQTWWKGVGKASDPRNWTAGVPTDATVIGFKDDGDREVLIDKAMQVAGIHFYGNTSYRLTGSSSIDVKGDIANVSNVVQTLERPVYSDFALPQTYYGGPGLNLTLGGNVRNQLKMVSVDAILDRNERLRVQGVISAGPATLELVSGSLDTAAGAWIGMLGPSDARMRLTGSRWTSGDTVVIGGGQAAADVLLEHGSELNAYGLELRQNGRLTLAGARLSFDTLSRSGDAMLDWQRGTVHARRSLPLSALGDVVTLNNDRLLQVDAALSVANGQTLVLSGKSQLKTPELRLAGGVLRAGALGDEVGHVIGHGQWLGVIDGGPRLIAISGRMRLGDATQAGAVALTGQLLVGTDSSAQLDSLSLSRLGYRTLLAGRGSVLAAEQGIALAAGARLDAPAGGRVEGPFVNDGLVVTRLGLSPGQALVLAGEVSGSGRFEGAFDFLAGLSPGGEGSTGTLSFGGASEAWLGAGSRLTLDLVAGHGGWTFDRLAGLRQLHAGGELQLRFHGMAAVPAEGWQVLGFDRLDGAFSRITVQGLDAGWTVDTSELMTTGRLSVSAVSEPASVALWLAGAGLLATRRRQTADRRAA